MNNGVMLSPRNNQPRKMPTTGWAKNVSEAAPASRMANALFHRIIANAVDMTPRKSTPPITPGLISPTPAVDNSHAPAGSTTGRPPTKAIRLNERTSRLCVILRTSTEYKAHVIAAPNNSRLPRNNSGFNCAERGSITVTTPQDASRSATRLSSVIFALSSIHANSSTKADVVDVTSEPFAADESFVARNCRLNETPYPTIPTPTTCRNCRRENFGKP